MFEGMPGRLVSGAPWRLGAGVALKVVGNGGAGLRPVARRLIKGVLVISERAQEVAAEAREQLAELYAEVRAEQHAQAPGDLAHEVPAAPVHAPEVARPA